MADDDWSRAVDQQEKEELKAANKAANSLSQQVDSLRLQDGRADAPYSLATRTTTPPTNTVLNGTRYLLNIGVYPNYVLSRCAAFVMHYLSKTLVLFM